MKIKQISIIPNQNKLLNIFKAFFFKLKEVKIELSLYSRNSR